MPLTGCPASKGDWGDRWVGWVVGEVLIGRRKGVLKV